MKLSLTYAAAAALLLAGCAAPSAQVAPAAASPAPSLMAHATTRTPSGTATVSSLEAVITAHEKQWRDYDANTAHCDKAAQGVSANDIAASMACVKDTEAVTASAQDASSALTSLGNPPTDLRTLVERTLKALAPLKDSKAQDTCQDATSDACDASVQQVSDNVSTLGDVLDDWDDYIRPQ